MPLLHYLFGLSGRINRAKQWAVLLVGLVHGIIIGFAFSFTIGFASIVDVVQGKTTLRELVATPQAHVFATIFAVLYAIGFYIGCAVATKRLHDRNRSAWWLLVFVALPLVLQLPLLLYLPALIGHLGAVIHAAQTHAQAPLPPLEPPLVTLSRGASALIGLWAFVELYCLSGTPGDNQYGPNPLARRA
jgi:uncharacterized membrane protein YhaH (DUF805 family)